MAVTPRTTEDAVKAILAPGKDYDLDDNPSLTPFITAAAILIARVEVCATARDHTLTEDELTEMEGWLAAHFYVVSDKNYQSKSTSKGSATFIGKTDMYLDSTLYGQTAKVIDTSGCLTSLTETAAGVQRRSGGHWLGRVPSQQTEYDARD